MGIKGRICLVVMGMVITILNLTGCNINEAEKNEILAEFWNASGTASILGYCQPKEPKVLKKHSK